jgi:CRISPR system Cascade subunit CasC
MNTSLPKIEYHILQSFPVTCLNRDDVGSPKTAIVGGTTRARVSSQCWKRQVRVALKNLGVKIGVRTKKIEDLLINSCIELGCPPEDALKCAETLAKEVSDDTLIFMSKSEADQFARYAKEHSFKADDIKPKEFLKLTKKILDKDLNGLDIGLFGRMVAKAADMNIEASASFSHALSTHKISNEIDFFTALDDLEDRSQNTGSAHMGSLEFNSATYYRYVSLDPNQLVENLGDIDVKSAIEYFTKALFIAVPEARQHTQSGASPWEYAQVLVRRGQRLQVPFETAVKPKNGGFLEPSIETLKDYLNKKEMMFGSMFNKVATYEWGLDESYSVDALIENLKNHY